LAGLVSTALLDAIRQFDGGTISNAIETRDVRLRNEGFADGTIRCVFDDLPPVVGYAVTARIRCSSPPPVGHSYPASILRALGCVAYATNGSVRDLRPVRGIGFQLFAKSISVSHAFVHLVDFAQPITVGGLRVGSGDIVYGDRHGLLTIPPAMAGDIPVIAARMLEQEQRVIELCQSPDFSLERLRTLVRQPG
jgi:4-hydroxy-4-methyl-2-oxoglutarate aldolase